MEFVIILLSSIGIGWFLSAWIEAWKAYNQ